MRVIVFFDLPTQTLEDKREYRKFRKFLIKKGFLMMQESVYCRLVLNQTVASAVVTAIKNNKPKWSTFVEKKPVALLTRIVDW